MSNNFLALGHDVADAMAITDAPRGLKAITVNGAVIVESEEDRLRRKEERAKKRKSRWDKSSHPEAPRDKVALPTMINIANADTKAQEIYILQLQIREATNKLGLPSLGIPINPKDRSPSPEPIYNSKGIRMNTRQERTKAKLINQRNNAITKLKVLDPSYQPPTCFQYKNSKLEDKIEVPQDEYPQYNFMGLLLGPRGNSLEKIKQKFNCKIIVKGRGSLKDGMTGIKKDGTRFDALDEPMHVMINGPTPEAVKDAGDHIRKLIKLQVEDPDGEKMVALRAAHMHELAVLNGTLKENLIKCLNCGREGHKTWECPESECVTASIICSACGGVGHVTSDCRARRPGEVWNQSSGGAELDEEYDAFLSDLGVKKKAKVMVEDKPYVPPMGDLSKVLGKPTISSSRLMLTNGSAAPGAASKQARKFSATGVTGLEGKSIFGGKLTYLNSGFEKAMGLEKEPEKKPDPNTPVPTHWQAELHDKAQAKAAEQEMLRLEHAKLLAKIEKRKEESKVIHCSAPPPPPPGAGSYKF